MARVWGKIALVWTLAWSSAAAAQARVSVVGWTKDGSAVLRIKDPTHEYQTDSWAAGAATTFLAVCAPAALDATEDSCRVCANERDCPVERAGSRRAALAVTSKRTCSGPEAAPESCDLAIRLGDKGSVNHHLWAPRFRAVLDKSLRPDGRAVALVLSNDTPVGDLYDTFLVLSLERAAVSAAGDAQVRGSLDKEVIRRTIQRHLNEVKFCYERELQKQPSLSGKVIVQFT